MERSINLKIPLQLFLLPLVFIGGVAAGEEQVGGNETAWLTFSTHDVELVARRHENATVFLLLRGTTHECFSVNFTYDPLDPTIAPINDFLICPDLPSTTSTASPSPPSPHKDCRGCESERIDESRDVSFLPSRSLPGPLLLLLQRWGFRAEGRRQMFSEGGDVVANVTVELVSRRVGKTVLGVTTNCSSVGVTDAFVRVSVIHSRALDVASDVIGWMYTIFWDASFLPQVWLNWRRKSVEGFSLDNVTLNSVAYVYYTLFNIGFFWIPYIKDQFKERYPRTVNHVQANDVFFAIYSLCMQIVLAVQCFLYGRNAGMRVSWPCIGFVGASVLAVGVDCILVAAGVVWWLDVFYLMSYMKLIITPLKYIPQMYVIYRIKSTKGFSVTGAMIDFPGGVLSLAQMFLLSANSDDYLSIFTNFSKFGLGVITLFFDAIYFCQHWYYHLRRRN